MSRTARKPVSAPRLTSQGQATKDRIVRAAADLMAERGAARTTVEDVLETAGVSASQLYHYFGDKGGLVRAVVAFQADAAFERQQPFLDHLDSFDDLKAWRDQRVSLQIENGCAGGCELGALASELVESSPEARAYLAAAFTRWQEPIRSGLHRMRERGEMRAEADPDKLSAALLAALQGGVLLTQIHRDPEQLAAALDAVLEHIRSFAV
ncbi:TetR/AcrR family transcriptional regulator [Streptomyces sp. AK02-01A]|uniref:TetR/AcrR family transcriptional regulator n=1 Tax=Streptomyces sp. AK02-01A TaxID=3028648 RepID=UPI0029B7EAD0|nr:TetR/AcrR family transcriptional regulator [Streptomyces sp. AK02-01A]MDX3852748.1 TetR/AcrR family transcriptional regulator [Streptomyces sp. AK02-01A]